MKKIVKIFCVLSCVFVFSACDNQVQKSPETEKIEKSVPAEPVWLTDFEKAKETAAKENKPILLVFSGSDWCSWCIKLDREVFSTPAFKKWVVDNIVCMLTDFPAVKNLAPDLKKQNEKLRDTYNVEGYPTVFLLKADGSVIARTGYMAGGAAKYIKHLKMFIGAAR